MTLVISSSTWNSALSAATQSSLPLPPCRNNIEHQQGCCCRMSSVWLLLAPTLVAVSFLVWVTPMSLVKKSPMSLLWLPTGRSGKALIQ
jgi:hypothetical protein